jgi:tripartite-type tricarboxylate transporter receptor subunit TctC
MMNKQKKGPMNHTRRTFVVHMLGAAVVVAAALGMTGIAAAADFPTKRMTMVVAFPPGGGVDNTARLIAHRLGENLKQTVIVENRPGAGGNIAAGVVAKAAPDGHTILFTAHAGIVIAKATKTPLPFDPMKDLTPVAFPAYSLVGLLVNPNSPIQDFKDFIAHAKANPGKMNFGTNGIGSSYHIALEKIKADAGVNIVHVPFQGGNPSMQALLGGQIDAIFASVTQSIGQINAGKLRLIALASNRKTPLFPNVQTIAESGILPGYDQSSNYGIFAPAGTPVEIINKLNAEIARAVQDPAVKAAMDKEGVNYPGDLSAKEFAALLKKDLNETESLIKRAKLDLK